MSTLTPEGTTLVMTTRFFSSPQASRENTNQAKRSASEERLTETVRVSKNSWRPGLRVLDEPPVGEVRPADEGVLELVQGVLDRKLYLHLDIHGSALHLIHRHWKQYH